MTILGIFTALTYTQMIAVLVVLLLGVAVGGFLSFPENVEESCKGGSVICDRGERSRVDDRIEWRLKF